MEIGRLHYEFAVVNPLEALVLQDRKILQRGGVGDAPPEGDFTPSTPFKTFVLAC
jgi:hypothetical protein